MNDFIARVDREHGPPIDSVKVSLHESILGAWRGFFFCTARDQYRVGEVLRLTLVGGRVRTAVVYATEQVAGKSMWVVDLIGADPSAKARAEDADGTGRQPGAPGAGR
jgi:hypothetical protein